MSVKINIKGIERLAKELKKRQELMWKTIMEVIDEYVDKMIQDAQANAPEDLGLLKNAIGKEKKDDRTMVFLVESVYAAMQEFGTGPQVDVPEELADQAMEFKGYKDGTFAEFVERLREWCSRKGIDPDAAYPIALKILNQGLSPRPFFYPAYLKYRDLMIEEIKRRLQELFNI